MIASVIWWIGLIIDQLRLTLDCDPSDTFCMSGNTILGDVLWGTIMAVYSLLFLWVPLILIGLIIQKIRAKKTL